MAAICNSRWLRVGKSPVALPAAFLVSIVVLGYRSDKPRSVDDAASKQWSERWKEWGWFEESLEIIGRMEVVK